MRPSGARVIHLSIFLAGAAALIAIAIHIGTGPILRALATLKYGGLAIVTIMHLPVIALMGLGWWFVGGAVTGAGPGGFIVARLARDSIAEILPFSQLGGFMGGVRLLVLSGSKVLQASLAMFADLVAEFSTKLLYALAGLFVLAWLLPHAPIMRPMSFGLAAAFLGFGVLLFLRRQFRSVLNRFMLWALRKCAPFQAIDQPGRDLARLFAPRHFLPGLLIHALCWLLGAAEAWVTFRLMDVGMGLGQAMVIDSLGTAIRTLGFFVPGALGVQEAGYVIVCAVFGITPATAVAFSLARRARDIVIGLMGLAIWQSLEVKWAAVRWDPSGRVKL